MLFFVCANVLLFLIIVCVYECVWVFSCVCVLACACVCVCVCVCECVCACVQKREKERVSLIWIALSSLDVICFLRGHPQWVMEMWRKKESRERKEEGRQGRCSLPLFFSTLLLSSLPPTLPLSLLPLLPFLIVRTKGRNTEGEDMTRKKERSKTNHGQYLNVCVAVCCSVLQCVAVCCRKNEARQIMGNT